MKVTKWMNIREIFKSWSNFCKPAVKIKKINLWFKIV